MHIDKIANGYRVEFMYYVDKKRFKRTTNIQLNQRYVVVPPLYSKQLKMLDRECIIVDFLEDESGFVHKAKVRYIDNNRVGRMSFENLVSKDSLIEKTVR
ncbi:hypothetical protein [Paenibacillus glacialis]|uniref:Uncharacterized protein n=1 Tax=Paenibacillus glacialis TaxID=494026 RepID=A0A168NP73_9BACL|nr:hypothetical protein [Paenibacillus glacialis]OAB45989.1 hypothetical protein PGLA_00910 [Paenibacillus glacialis]